MSEIITTQATENVQAVQAFTSLPPDKMIERATGMADVLAKVIEGCKLYSNISGKKYVHVDGWLTLGSMLGYTAREKTVTRLEDGSYEASVDICRITDGLVLGGASALCSIKERRWANADEYARRSMAITRAVGKAYRINFSWIIALAGYESTPEEEMPDEKRSTHTQQDSKAPAEKLAGSVPKESKKYLGTTEQQELITGVLKARSVPEEYWPEIHEKMMNKHGKDLPGIINDIVPPTN